MSVRLVAVAVLGVCSALSCQPAGEDPSDAERRAVAEAVTAGMRSYAEALGALDSARILSHYVAGSDFRLASDGRAYSYAEMEQVIGNLRTVLTATIVQWDTVAVTVLSRDAAFVYAPFRRTDTELSGAVHRIRGNATWVWVQRDGAWRMLYGHGDHYPDTSATR